MMFFLYNSKRFVFKILTAFFLFSFDFCVFSNDSFYKPDVKKREYKQWFTGSILTPNPKTVPRDHPGLELELISSKHYGFYNSKRKLEKTDSIWGIRPLFDFQCGFNSVIGAELIGSLVTNFSQGESSTNPADSIFRLGFQISNDKENSWIPDFRILLQEIFPTGKYQKLKARKKGADATGHGSFQTGIQFVFQKAFSQKEKHPFSFRGSIGYFVPSQVDVKGINVYGGDNQTKGTIYPGKYFTNFFYGEYSLSRRWAVGCEFNYLQGETGNCSISRGPRIRVLQFKQLSILPEIQHTYTENIGIVIGGWFTISGQNSKAFSKLFGAVLFLF